MRARASAIGAGLLLCALAGNAQAPDPILKVVDQHYNRLTTLRTRYVERYTGMGLSRTESGTLTLKKPGRMRWAYDTPAGKLFILDGKFAWFYTPGDTEAQRLPAKKMDDLRTPLRFLLGHTELNKELTGVQVIPAASGMLITGTPRGMESRVRLLSLQVTLAGAIMGMKLEEIDGATTEFVFMNMQENLPERDIDFTFTAPPGVAVVNAAPPI